jgi:hypothetical protein
MVIVQSVILFFLIKYLGSMNLSFDKKKIRDSSGNTRSVSALKVNLGKNKP